VCRAAFLRAAASCGGSARIDRVRFEVVACAAEHVLDAGSTMTTRREHWERVYRDKQSEARSWFQPRPETSLELVRLARYDPSARIIDIGGGTARLVDVLLEQGYRNVTVLDIAPSALEEAKQRLGESAARVRWIEADVTSVSFDEVFDLWHDRAVFHFLTEPDARAAYVHTLRGSLEVGGHVVLATFAEDGPTHCSGLPVVRYAPDSLLAELGGGFEPLETRREAHATPGGRVQNFVYCLFRWRGSGGES
jgi:SAM-dependent methyltransferase